VRGIAVGTTRGAASRPNNVASVAFASEAPPAARRGREPAARERPRQRHRHPGDPPGAGGEIADVVPFLFAPRASSAVTGAVVDVNRGWNTSNNCGSAWTGRRGPPAPGAAAPARLDFRVVGVTIVFFTAAAPDNADCWAASFRRGG